MHDGKYCEKPQPDTITQQLQRFLSPSTENVLPADTKVTPPRRSQADTRAVCKILSERIFLRVLTGFRQHFFFSSQKRSMIGIRYNRLHHTYIFIIWKRYFLTLPLSVYFFPDKITCTYKKRTELPYGRSPAEIRVKIPVQLLKRRNMNGSNQKCCHKF